MDLISADLNRAKMNNQLYTLEKAAFAYRPGEWTLQDLTFSIPCSALTAVIGPNGAGKSTLLKLLSRQIPVHAGKIDYLGKDVHSYRNDDWSRRIAWLPQKPTIAFPLTVYELVRLGCWPITRSWFDREQLHERVMEAVHLVGISHLTDRPVPSLSGGEQQLAHMARALAQNPETLLLDEPLTFLDFRHIVDILDRLHAWTHSKKMNVIMVAHDLNMVAHYADWVVLMHHGKVIAVGPPEDVLTYPNLKKAFETEVYIDINDLTGKLIILPLPPDHWSSAPSKPL